MAKNPNDRFCIVPFIHLSTAPLGSLRPCCFSSQYRITNKEGENFNFGRDSLQEIWTSESYQKLRSDFLAGNPPLECKACFDEEKLGKKSKRQKENAAYAHLQEAALENFKVDAMKTMGPRTLDLRLGNLCNLKCLSCNPIFSSPIEKEMKSQWPDQFFEKAIYKDIDYDNQWFETQSFYQNAEALVDDLEFIYVSGGEPTINPGLAQFLQLSIEKDRARHQELRFNTNLASYSESFYSMLCHFKKVDISISLDAIGNELRLIRYPLNFKTIEEHFEKLLKLEGPIEITFNCTVSLLNIFSLKDFYTWVDKKSQESRRYFHIAVDLVHEPSYLNLKYLSPRLRERALGDISAILESVRLKTGAKKDLESLIPLLKAELPSDSQYQAGLRAQFMHTMNSLRSLEIESLEGMALE